MDEEKGRYGGGISTKLSYWERLVDRWSKIFYRISLMFFADEGNRQNLSRHFYAKIKITYGGTEKAYLKK